MWHRKSGPVVKERGGPGQSCWLAPVAQGKRGERVLWFPSSFFLRLPACTPALARETSCSSGPPSLGPLTLFLLPSHRRDAHSGSVTASHPSMAQCRAGVAWRRSRWMLLQQNRRGQEKRSDTIQCDVSLRTLQTGKVPGSSQCPAAMPFPTLSSSAVGLESWA